MASGELLGREPQSGGIRTRRISDLFVGPGRRAAEAAALQIQENHRVQVAQEAALSREMADTIGVSSRVPDLSVAFLNLKGGSSKTATAVHTALALAYARDKTTTIIDTNKSGKVHERLGFHHPDDLRGINTRNFATLVKTGYATTKEAIRKALQSAIPEPQNRVDFDVDAIVEDQAKALAGKDIEGVKGLKAGRQTTQQGIGFIASSPSLTGPESKNIIAGNKLISDYTIYDMGNEIGDGEGETDVRNFVLDADIFVFTVNANVRNSWTMLVDNFRRIERVCEDLPTKEAEALREKRKRSIIVVSGLDPTITIDEAVSEFINETRIIQGTVKNPGRPEPQPLLDTEEEIFTDDTAQPAAQGARKLDLWIGEVTGAGGEFPWDGEVLGVPFDQKITEDVDYSLEELQIPTRTAYQRIANRILARRYYQNRPDTLVRSAT